MPMQLTPSTMSKFTKNDTTDFLKQSILIEISTEYTFIVHLQVDT